MTGNRVFGLDLMRAVAIILVVINHGYIFLSPVLTGYKQQADFFGFIGVEMFFVLSGFLIGSIILKTAERDRSPSALGDFWVRRWFRTLPNYFLFLLVHYLFWSHMAWRMEPVAPYFLFLQTVEAGGQTFFPIAWSLAIEEWFYILFPLMLWVSFRLVAVSADTLLEHCAKIIVLMLAVFIAIRFAVVLMEDPYWGSGVRLRLITRLDAPLYGVLAAWLAHAHADLWYRFRQHSLLIGLLTLLAVFLLYMEGTRTGESFFMKTLFFTVTSLSFALMLPALSNWKSAGGRFARGVTLLSLWSYSLYLCHDVVRRAVYVLLNKLGLFEPHHFLMFGALFLFVSIGLSSMVYRYFEKPVMDLRDRLRLTRG